MYSSRRLRKEYQAICKSPIDYVKAHPLESNILVSIAVLLLHSSYSDSRSRGNGIRIIISCYLCVIELNREEWEIIVMYCYLGQSVSEKLRSLDSLMCAPSTHISLAAFLFYSTVKNVT